MAKGEKPLFDYELCMACGICVQSCPTSCLELSHFEENGLYRKPLPELVRSNDCIGCGFCAKDCPIDVVELK